MTLIAFIITSVKYHLKLLSAKFFAPYDFLQMNSLQLQTLWYNLNMIVSRPNVRRGQILNSTNCIPISFVSQESFPTNTQVWNSLSYLNDRRVRGVI